MENEKGGNHRSVCRASLEDAPLSPATVYETLVLPRRTRSTLAHHECLITGAASVTLSGARGMENEKVAPGPSFGSAQRRP